jgi:hypothetical protein
MFRAVNVGLELGAVFGDAAPFGKAEHLIATAVSQDGPVPSDETVQAAEPSNELIARSKVQVVGVTQDDFGARSLQVLEQRSFDRALGADRHEGGRMDDAVRRLKLAKPGTSVGTRQQKRKGVGSHLIRTVECFDLWVESVLNK